MLDAIRDHVPILRSEGLATDREPTVMRAADGTYLEVFEWASAQAFEAAHSGPVVQKLWDRFGEACEYAVRDLPRRGSPAAESRRGCESSAGT